MSKNRIEKADGRTVRIEDENGEKVIDIEELREKIVKSNGNPQILECLHQIVNYLEQEC